MDLDRLETLGRGVEDQPSSPDGWLALAEALLDHGVPDLARPMIDRALGCSLSRTDQWKLLTELALRLGDRRAARQALHTVVALDEDDAEAVALLARVAIEDDEADEVVPILKKAIARGDHPELRRWLVQAIAKSKPRTPAAASTPISRPSSIPPVWASSVPPARSSSMPSSPESGQRRSMAVLGQSSTGFTGDLQVFSLPEMLEFLAQQRSTGTLQILSKQHSANVHLHEGRITDVEHPLRPSLLSMLNERGQTMNARLRALPIEVMADEASLCKVAVEEGIIQPEVLQDAIRARIEDGVFRVLQWTESYAQFRTGPPAPAIHEGFDAHWILLSVMQRLDEVEKS